MTNTYKQTGTGTGAGTGAQAGKQVLHSSEIKSLVQKNGKTIIGNNEFVLKYPTANDPKLQEIVNDPGFSATPTGGQSGNGEFEYDLKASGKSLKIKVACTKNR